MSQYAVPELVRGEHAGGERTILDRSGSGTAASGLQLLFASLVLGVMGDTLLRAPGEPALNVAVWVAAVALAAVVLHRRTGLALDRGRVVWLSIAVLFAAGLAWRDSPALKVLALWCVTLAFALAAYRVAADWVRRAGVFRYVRAWATGALHAWIAAAFVLIDAIRSTPRPEAGQANGMRRATAILRGLIIATPLVLVFGALFMSADAVFADLVRNVLRIDFDLVFSHVLLFLVSAWVATGYLRGFLTGTELPPLRSLGQSDAASSLVLKRPALSITEVTTVLTALDLLFLSFVIVQFRYLFGGDALVQVTPDLTYAEYARRGFFELVVAVGLVVPVLLAADWLLARARQRDDTVFRALSGVQIALVLAIAASALQRLRLYHASYGLTDSRLYAMVLLLWIGLTLVWFVATVLRGRRDSFAFGALASGLATVALLFVLNPNAIVARTNVARVASAGATVPFDVAYATSLSADAAPVLIDGLPSLPRDAQCQLAAHLLRRWGPDGERSLRTWNSSAARARDVVRENEALLQSMVGPARECAASAPAPASH